MGSISDQRLDGRIRSQGQAVAVEDDNQESAAQARSKKRVLRKKEWPSLIEAKLDDG